MLEPLAVPYGGAGGTPSAHPPLLAYDGGATDNLGIRTLMSVVNEALSAHSMSQLFPRGCLAVSIDATGRQNNGARKPISAAAALLKGHRRNVLELAGIPAAEQDATMVGTFQVGPAGAGGLCHFWHIALRQLPESDSLGARVTAIKTNLGLTAEDQALLIEAAARLVSAGRDAMTRRADWAAFIMGPPAIFSEP